MAAFLSGSWSFSNIETIKFYRMLTVHYVVDSSEESLNFVTAVDREASCSYAEPPQLNLPADEVASSSDSKHTGLITSADLQSTADTSVKKARIELHQDACSTMRKRFISPIKCSSFRITWFFSFRSNLVLRQVKM